MGVYLLFMFYILPHLHVCIEYLLRLIVNMVIHIYLLRATNLNVWMFFLRDSLLHEININVVHCLICITELGACFKHV